MINSKLHHYLDCEVKMQYPDTISNYPLVVSNNTRSIRGGITLDQCNEQNLQPYLYPLSCLTEPIPYKGEMVVPLVELAKVEGFYKDGMVHSIQKDGSINLNDGSCIDYDFNYKKSSFELYDNNVQQFIIVYNQLALFQLMLKMRINIFPDEIDSIDPRTLGDLNPYKL